ARPRRRPSRPPLRRGADRAARPARPRLLEGPRRRARAEDAPRLERAAELGARGRPAAPSPMSLDGASVLVTGGTRGIGRAIALRLVADGAARAVLGYMRNDTAAEEAAALVEEAGAEPV